VRSTRSPRSSAWTRTASSHSTSGAAAVPTSVIDSPACNRCSADDQAAGRVERPCGPTARHRRPEHRPVARRLRVRRSLWRQPDPRLFRAHQLPPAQLRRRRLPSLPGTRVLGLPMRFMGTSGTPGCHRKTLGWGAFGAPSPVAWRLALVGERAWASVPFTRSEVVRSRRLARLSRYASLGLKAGVRGRPPQMVGLAAAEATTGS
jgi:hypothetical protein